jgi:hypothetical protein
MHHIDEPLNLLGDKSINWKIEAEFTQSTI